MCDFLIFMTSHDDKSLIFQGGIKGNTPPFHNTGSTCDVVLSLCYSSIVLSHCGFTTNLLHRFTYKAENGYAHLIKVIGSWD